MGLSNVRSNLWYTKDGNQRGLDYPQLRWDNDETGRWKYRRQCSLYRCWDAERAVRRDWMGWVGLTTSAASEPRGTASFFFSLPFFQRLGVVYGAPPRRHCVARWVEWWVE